MRTVDIKGFDQRYEVNEVGEIRNKQSDVWLSKRLGTDGYQVVNLYDGSRKRIARVHRLVAEAFIPNPDNKSTVNHIDGDKLNNNVENLEWATQWENIKHAFNANLVRRNGVAMKLRPVINRKRTSKLVTEDDRQNIKRLREKGALLRQIQELYNLSIPYISMIANGSA